MGKLMESTPGKPPKKRRRWQIVAFVLAMVSGVAWWNWPRGDARFVGKWKVTYAASQQEGIIYLRSHGRGSTKVAPNFRSIYSWRIEGDRLIVGQKVPEQFQGAVNWLTSSFESLTGTAIMLEEESIEVLEVTQNVIRARDASSPTMGELTLTRIPE